MKITTRKGIPYLTVDQLKAVTDVIDAHKALSDAIEVLYEKTDIAVISHSKHIQVYDKLELLGKPTICPRDKEERYIHINGLKWIDLEGEK
jgi:hypothetical protein